MRQLSAYFTPWSILSCKKTHIQRAMPRLSDYLAGQHTAVAAASSTADRPTQAAQPVLQQAQHVHQSSSNASVAAPEGFEAEIARLQQQHANRVRQHGPRMYRQPDGSMSPELPDRQPYTVANRCKWHGLVQHCRQVPGVNPQLERTGQSARYGINVSHQQHITALAAVGLTPEADESGTWSGFKPGLDDPLEDDSHSLRHEDWGPLTSAVLVRAATIHGQDTLQQRRWDSALY